MKLLCHASNIKFQKTIFTIPDTSIKECHKVFIYSFIPTRTRCSNRFEALVKDDDHIKKRE